MDQTGTPPAPAGPEDGAAPVSTGRLPREEEVRRLVRQAWERHRGDAGGANASHYPALAEMPRDAFGICVVAVAGYVAEAGDAGMPFTIMSVAKPFVFALVCDALGAEEARQRIGVNATGLPFNSLAAVEAGPGGRTNPMVNAGAILATALVPGPADEPEARWATIRDALSRFAGHPLALDEATLASAAATNHRNRAIANLLASLGRLPGDPMVAVDLYTRQSCLAVTARDLAAMGATLANGGVNPVTGDRVVSADACRRTLAVMATAGLYETSGDWLYDVGMPGKSGVGGGILAIAPGKASIAVWSPGLDDSGNSHLGRIALEALTRRMGWSVFGA